MSIVQEAIEETASVAPAGLVTPEEFDQLVILSGINWKGYKTILRLRKEQSDPRAIYLDGNLFFVSPSYVHEWLEDRYDTFVKEVFLGLAIPCTPTRSTTFRRRSKEAGVEGDLTYYFANAGRIRGKKKIDLRVDPPPDLAIEVVHTHEADAALEVYRRLGVPEVWIAEENRFRILVLQTDGRYEESNVSLSLPFLIPAEVLDLMRRPDGETGTDWGLEIRAWIRDVLAPRLGKTAH